MEVRIEIVNVEKIVELRHRVLRAGMPRESAVFPGDELSTSRHFAAMEEERVVGCLTLHWTIYMERPAYQLRGMATDEVVRGKGVGRELLEAAEAFVRGTRAGVMWCNARVPAAGFYERAGWQVVSKEFEIPTAGPHVRMQRSMG
jgi:GNAT superfamily N-acetyltransferase